jgi:catechol 2,3-dioxygenase-like lactoylglutathione lyase family enzyme
MTHVDLLQYNHANQVVENLDAAIAHFVDVLGAQLLWHVPPNPFVRACLVNFGGAIIELIEARRPIGGDMVSRRVEERYRGQFWYCVGTAAFVMDWDVAGPHFAGCEFRVADLREAIEASKSLGLHVIDQSDWRFALTYAAECQGISLELTPIDWYSPSAASSYKYLEEMKTARFWSDEHPLGVAGFRFSVAVDSVERAADFYRKYCGSEVRYRASCESIGAEAIGLQIADVVVEFVAPFRNAAIRSFMDRYGERIRSMIFAVKDMDAVRSYFDARRISLIDGDRPGRVATVPDQNLGVLYQFEPLS